MSPWVYRAHPEQERGEHRRSSSPGLEGNELKTPSRRALVIATCLLVVAGVILVGVRGCAFMPWNKSAAATGTVSVTISKDFGASVIKDLRVRVKAGQTAMELVKLVADVRTEYGGGLVSSIEGLSSSSGDTRSDWFYYVNGILSGTGAGSYQVRGGDNIWWDYHPWSGKNMASAVVGAYPMPFTRGLKEVVGRTAVVYGQGMESLARKAGGFLEKGGARMAYSIDVAGFAKGGAPSIAFLTFEQAKSTPWAAGLLGKPGAGSYLTFQGERLVALDKDGNPDASAGDLVAAVVSCGSGIGDASPVWLVMCGTGGTNAAGRLLSAGAAGLQGRFGVAVQADGHLISLPR